MFRVASLITVAAVAAGAAGCAATGEEREVRKVANQYAEAFVEGDGKTVCALMEPEMRDDWESLEAGCAVSFREVWARLPKSELELSGIKSLRVTDDVAVVEWRGKEGRPTTLRRIDGRWFVEGVAATG